MACNIEIKARVADAEALGRVRAEALSGVEPALARGLVRGGMLEALRVEHHVALLQAPGRHGDVRLRQLRHALALVQELLLAVARVVV